MSGFRMLDCEVGEAPSAVTLGEDEVGLALIVRRHGRPVGFAMHDAKPGTRFDASTLQLLCTHAAAEGALIDAVRGEIGATVDRRSLPGVTIAVCTHDRPRLLERCLTSIAAIRESASGHRLVQEVLVVDNAPSDRATEEVVARFPGVRRVLEPVAGLDVARNAAWRAATGDYVAYIDDDAVLDAAWPGGCARALAAHHDVGMITGLVLPYTLATEAQVLFERAGGFRRGFRPRRWRGAGHQDDRYFPLSAGQFGAGCNMVIRRDLLAALGGFDDALDTGAPLPGGGDLDIFYRVVRAGESLVYEPSMAVHHEHRRTVDELTRQYFTWGQGFFAFLEKVWLHEREARGNVARMTLWWATWMLRRLGSALLVGPRPLPVPMIAAELAGGVQGMLGEYRRSQDRMRSLRRAAT